MALLFLLVLGLAAIILGAVLAVLVSLIARRLREPPGLEPKDGLIEVTRFDSEEKAEDCVQFLASQDIEARLGSSYLVKPKVSSVLTAPLWALTGPIGWALRYGVPWAATAPPSEIAVKVAPEDEQEALRCLRSRRFA